MKGWMGGKRRNIAVRRKDLVARQREQFARRRELAQQSVRHQNRGAQMTMDMIENRSGPPPTTNAPHRERRPRAPQNAPRWVGKDPRLYSNDFVMVQDDSQLNSIVPEYRNARKRMRDQDVREQRESKRRNVSSRDRLVDASAPSYPSQDIRIFDADDEKTPLFRRRTLPDTFLNSQVASRPRTPKNYAKEAKSPSTRHNVSPTPDFERRIDGLKFSPSRRQRTSKYFAKELTSPPKRLKVSTVPDLSSRLHALKFSPPRRIGRLKAISREAPLNRRKASDQFEEVLRPPHLRASASEFLDIRPPSQDSEPSVRIPPVTSERLRGVSERTGDPVHRMAGRQVPESPEYAHTSPAERKVARSNLRSQSPVLSGRNMEAVGTIRSARLESRFPWIEAESDSPPVLSPIKKQPSTTTIGFRSLLASAPITPDDFSAEVKALEAKMFERPDSDGGRFKVRRRRRLQRGTEVVKHGETASNDQVFRTEGVGLATSGKVNKEPLSGANDVVDIELKLRTREKGEFKTDSAVAEPEVRNNNIVDVTLITTERNPINVARGQRHGDLDVVK